MVHHSFNVKLIFKCLFFSGMFSLTCQIDRVKARRKLGFGFGMITLDLDAPPSKGDSAVKIIISQM